MIGVVEGIVGVTGFVMSYFSYKGKSNTDVLKTEFTHLCKDISNINKELVANTKSHEVVTNHLENVDIVLESVVKSNDHIQSLMAGYKGTVDELHMFRSILFSELQEIADEKIQSLLNRKSLKFIDIITKIVGMISEEPHHDWQVHRNLLRTGYDECEKLFFEEIEDVDKTVSFFRSHSVHYIEFEKKLQNIYYSSKNGTKSNIIETAREFGVLFIQNGKQRLQKTDER